MRIVALSDTHRNHEDVKVPDGDMLIYAGDGDWRTTASMNPFLDWFESQPHKDKIIVAGNHDFIMAEAIWNEKHVYIKDIFTRGILYLENSGVEINGLNIWGSPVTPKFGNWAFMKKRGKEIAKVWNTIPDKLDILITHGPPMYTLDMTMRGEPVGCFDLLEKVQGLKPRLHIFGHIHNQHGVVEKEGTIFVNCSICNENYQPVNSPVIIDI